MCRSLRVICPESQNNNAEEQRKTCATKKRDKPLENINGTISRDEGSVLRTITRKVAINVMAGGKTQISPLLPLNRFPRDAMQPPWNISVRSAHSGYCHHDIHNILSFLYHDWGKYVCGMWNKCLRPLPMRFIDLMVTRRFAVCCLGKARYLTWLWICKARHID